jgi:hypothetical protein
MTCASLLCTGSKGILSESEGKRQLRSEAVVFAAARAAGKVHVVVPGEPFEV